MVIIRKKIANTAYPVACTELAGAWLWVHINGERDPQRVTLGEKESRE